MYLPFITILNWFNGLRTAMVKFTYSPMQWLRVSQLVIRIPLPKTPYVLKNLPKISLLGLRLKLILWIHLVLS